MGQLTSRAGLYLPGGGSTGTNLPDEPADIDKLNDNFRTVDRLLGARTVPSAASYTDSFDGDLVIPADDEILRMYSASENGLVFPRTRGGTRFAGTLAERDAFSAKAKPGDIWHIPETGYTYMRNFANDAWRGFPGIINPTMGSGFSSRGYTIFFDPFMKRVSVSFNAKHSGVPASGATIFTLPGLPGSTETRYYPAIAAEAGTPIPCLVRITGATVSLWQANSTAAASGSVYGASFEYSTL